MSSTKRDDKGPPARARTQRRSRRPRPPIHDAEELLAPVPAIASAPPGPGARVHSRPIALNRIDPDAIKVIHRLTRHGHTAYLVGGSVRDLLLGRTPKDFDIGTSARPSEVRSLFRNCRVIGRRFRLAHILFGGGKILEVATFRKEPHASDESEPIDELGRDWEPETRGFVPQTNGGESDLLIRHDNVFGDPREDAQRRDFTINGLFYDIDRNDVIDYVDGMPDLESGIVRTIRRPEIRLREDPIRILRAIKFSARLDMGIDPELYDAMVDQRHELERAAKPRVLEEIFRLLRGGAAHRSVYLMWDTGVLAVVLPELSAFLDDRAADGAEGRDPVWGRLAAIDQRQAAGKLPSDAVLLAALMWGPIEEWLQGVRDPSAAFDDFFYEVGVRLVVPKRIKDRMRALFAAQRRIRSGHAAGLMRREFFEEARTLFALDCEARGLDSALPAAAAGPAPLEREPTDGRWPRRRRRMPRFTNWER